MFIITISQADACARETSGHIYNLNAEQQQLIDQFLNEIESGEYFTDEDVQKESLYHS